MTEGARRAIAYVAGRLITGEEATGVFDPVAGRHIPFEGDVQPQVALYDYERHCRIGGGAPDLYDGGSGAHINLVMDGTSFRGFDHAKGHHFGGRTDGTEVSIFDCEDERRHLYALVGMRGAEAHEGTPC